MERPELGSPSEDTMPTPLAEGSRPNKVEENTGLFDIRTLANVTKQRISERMEAQSTEEALLASASHSFSSLSIPAMPAQPDPTYPGAEPTYPGAEPTYPGAEPTYPGAENTNPAPSFQPTPSGAVTPHSEPLADGSHAGLQARATAPTAAQAAPALSQAMPAQTASVYGDSAIPVKKPTPGWVYAVIVGVLALGGGGFFAYNHFAGGGDGEPMAAVAPADDGDEDETEEPAVEPLAEPTAEPMEEPEPEPVAEPEPEPEDEDEAKRKDETRAKKGKPNKASDKALRDAIAKRKLKASKKKQKKAEDTSDKKADIDDLLDQAASGKVLEAKKVDVPTKPTKKELTRGDAKKAMGPITPKAKGCYNLYNEAGTVTVRFTVSPKGKVTRAAATGKFKGTDTGKCVAKAVRRATFPEYDGAPKTFVYPFLLSR